MKLNKDIRDAICKNAMAKTGLIDEVKDLVNRYAAFAEKCRVIANDGIKDHVLEKAQAALMKKVPDKLLNTTTSGNLIRRDDDLLLNLQGLKFRIHFNGEDAVPGHVSERLHASKFDLAGGRIYKFCPSASTVVIDDVALIQEFHDLESAKSDLDDRILKAHQYVSGYVNSVSTDKRLIEVWPEAAALIPKETIAPVISNLPAIPVAELNKMFNLP